MNTLILHLKRRININLLIINLLIPGEIIFAQVQVTDFSFPQFELSNGDIVCLDGNGMGLNETFYEDLHIVDGFAVFLLPIYKLLYVFPEDYSALTLMLNDSGLVFIAYKTYWLPHDSSYTKYIPYKLHHIYVDSKGITQSETTYEYHGPDISILNSKDFCNGLDSLLNMNNDKLVRFTMFNESMYNLFYGALNGQERCVYYLHNLMKLCETRGVRSEIGGESLMILDHLKEVYNGLMGNPIVLHVHGLYPYFQEKESGSCR